MQGKKCVFALFVMILMLGILPVVVVNAQGPRRNPTPPPAFPPSSEPAIPTLGGPASPAAGFRDPLHWGFGIGANIPFDQTADLLATNLSLHGTLLYQFDPELTLEADLAYWFLQAAEDHAEDPHLLTLTGGFRYYFNSPVFMRAAGPHLDGGLGLYHFSDWTYKERGVMTDHDADNRVGFYGGLGFTAGSFDVTGRIHKSVFHTNDFWSVGIVLRFFFPSGLSSRGHF